MTCRWAASDTYRRASSSFTLPNTVLTRPMSAASSSGGTSATTYLHITVSRTLTASWTSDTSNPAENRSSATPSAKDTTSERSRSWIAFSTRSYMSSSR